MTGAGMTDLSVRIGALTLANPVMPASGTFAEGMAQAIDLDLLGAFVTKTITRELRQGNPLPRVAETESGLINSIGSPGACPISSITPCRSLRSAGRR